MRILTEKFSYGFIVFTTIFGIFEAYDKLISTIPNFSNFDIIGISITVILSILLLFWELNKAVLSHYPTFLRLDEVGSDFLGLSSDQLEEDGTPIEDSMKIMIRRRGRLKNLVRPKQLIIRIRTQFEIVFDGGGGIILNDDLTQTNEKDGFKNWLYIFADSNMEENSLAYSFRIRHPRNAEQHMPYEMYAIPNCTITLNYDFGFLKRFSFTAREIDSIQHG